MINNRDCFFYKKSDFINRLQDLSPDSVCYIADTQQIYTHGRYFECNVTQDIVEQLIQNHGYLTPADLPVLTGGASPTPDEYVTGVSVGGHNINVQKGKLSEINVGSASKLETPRKIELSGDLSGSTMFDGSQDVNIETIVHNSTTASRLTTPRTISLSSQATGQVSFDGSGNVNIPVTVNELDSKNANNRDLNSLVTLNGYGGNLFYGIGGNTSINKPSGIDWFGLFSFKSASGNYTTQILGSNNRLYSRSNADTSLGSWNTIAYLTDNVASATKLQNTRTFTISDGTNSGTASNFDGTGNVTLRLPRTINANIVGNVTGDIVGDITGDLHGNADTATKLQTGRNINGTLFDGTKNITTAQWGTARNIGIVNSDGTGTAVLTSVNGSVNVNLKLPATIKANLQGNVTGDITGNLNGNASTASKLQTARTITLTGDATGSTSFNGSANVSIAVDVNTASRLATARTISLTGDASGSASFDGSANISIPVTIANDSHTHATSASSNATTNLTITAGGTTATVADLYATYADQLRTARTISLTGDVTGSTSFNGTGNVSINATVANNSHTHTFANISDKPLSGGWSQNNNNNITTAQFLDLLEDAGAFKYGWFHARGLWSYASTSNITDTGYGTLDLAGCAITVWGIAKTKCTILVIPPLDRAVSSSVALGTIYLYINNGEEYTSGWRKIARFEDIDWNNITNKPSSFTPSSHTHSISQVTGRGKLTFTGAATGTYDGSGNLTINIPAGGGEADSVAWNNITGKPSTFTPAAHTHGTDNITALRGYSEGSATTTLSASMTLNAALASLQNQVQAKAASTHTHIASQVSGLADVATSGDYNDLSNKPTIPSLSGYATQTWVNSQIDAITPASIGAAKASHTHTASQISGLSDVATSGSYNDLTNKPSIPAAVTVDSALSSTSTNPVQNKVINSALAGKAASSHNHSAANITSGTLAIARIPTGTTSSTVALGNHTHNVATTSAAGFMSAADKSKLDGISSNADAVSVSRNLTSGTQIASININGTATALYAPTNTDTKNTAGSTNSLAKLFLIGATSQAANPVTYSNSSVYTTNGDLHASSMHSTDGFYETSDARLKTFGEDIKALDVVSEIPTKYFTWKSDESKTEHIGTSAQEIQKLYPDLVIENEDGVLSVDYARLSIIALAAIKELKAQINELKSKIN